MCLAKNRIFNCHIKKYEENIEITEVLDSYTKGQIYNLGNGACSQAHKMAWRKCPGQKQN